MPELAIDSRTIGGAFSVDENARRLRHYRYAEARCMEAAAGWAASMPTIKVKLALGEHQFHDAWHAQWFGERLTGLREVRQLDLDAPPMMRATHVEEPPNEAFAKFIEELQDAQDELQRLTGLYRVLKTHLAVYYRHHMLVTDQVCDAPTVRVLRMVLAEEEEHVRWGQAIYEELADTPEKRRAALEWQLHLEELLGSSGGVTGGR